LPNGQVEPQVTLDDILSAFDPKTRAAFKIWQQALAAGINGRGEQINASFARLEPFAEHANQLVGILASQEGALRDVVKYTGVVFKALGSRDHQLEGLIVNGEHTFKAAAQESRAFAEAFEALPTFEHNSTVALKEIDKFAATAAPLLEEFRPAERQLSSLVAAAKPFAPEFDRFNTSLGPLTKYAKTGLPAFTKSLSLTEPILENLRPVLHNLSPFLAYAGTYVHEIQSFFANLTSASQFQLSNGDFGAHEGNKQHLLTTLSVLNPGSLAIYGEKPGAMRSNAYPLAGNYNQIASGLPSFETNSCGNRTPSVNGPASEAISESVILKIIAFHVANPPEKFEGFNPKEEPEKKELAEAEKQPRGTNLVAAPPCRQQGPSTFNGKTSQFPHVVYEGK
jgi:phospholipid/cholesterol/gamma-HCH transport system substrate-binding protein